MFSLFSQHSKPTFDTVAAVDLGSNSFHLIVAKVVDGHIEIKDRMKEMVRLASGLDAQRNLTQEIQDKAVQCLERFGQRLRELPLGSVRAAGTNTLRTAHNAEAFLARAEQALGHPIEIIAGREEARLVYLGIAHGLPDTSRQCFAMDIGGGSTEFIIGKGFEPIQRESLFMGCVNMSQRFFASGEISPIAMRQAEIAAQLELQPIVEEYRQAGWEMAVGSSGSIRSIGQVIRENGWSNDGITLSALEKLREAVISAGHIDKLNLAGLSEDRKPVFIGGLSILLGAFRALNINDMQVSDYALREGLVYDLIGRINHTDIREATIERLMKNFRVDSEQAKRVMETAASLHQQARVAWEGGSDECHCILRWAAQLHEIGLSVAHNQYHKHGAYILSNADLAGFSHREQNLLALIVRGHRRKFPREAFNTLPEGDAPIAIRLCVLLRLAVLLHRGQSNTSLPSCGLSISKKGALSLKFAPGWLEEHPLTKADLEYERAYLAEAGILLKFK